MSAPRLTRRALLGSALSLAAPLGPADAGGRSRDRGIGGTGAVDGPSAEDRGIGGTGVIGAICAFGSIVVNGLHISYPQDVTIEIDGRPAAIADLRIGHIAHVMARPSPGGYATGHISIISEVVGPIDSVGRGAIVVLGQTVSTRYIGDKGWMIGDWIAVSGLRRLDGVIVASLVEPRNDGPARVAGPVEMTPGGAARIGRLTLADIDPAHAGRRLLAEVVRVDGAHMAARIMLDPELAALSDARDYSIETYIRRKGAAARLGSGIALSTPHETVGAFARLPARHSRAIVAVAPGPDGKLRAMGHRLAPEPQMAQPKPPGPMQGPVPADGDR